MNGSYNFAHKKATQALNFFAIRNGGEIDKLHALKLVFFADRYHLRKFARPITNDQYWAMKFGPVPSGVKDLFEMDSISHDERHYASSFMVAGAKRDTVRSIAAVDERVLSQSDIEALTFAWSSFGRHSGIVERTHQYPEWQRHESTIRGGATRIAMDYLDFLEDPAPGVNPCHTLTDVERQARREQLLDASAAWSLWR